MVLYRNNWPGAISGALLVLLVGVVGCSSSSDDTFRVKSSGSPAVAQPQPAAPAAPATPPAAPAAEVPSRRPVAMPPGIARPEDVTADFGSSPAPTSPPPAPMPPVPPPPSSPQALPAAAQGQYVRADVGVGQKGSSLQPGFLTTPVYVYFRSQEHMAFRIQVPQALQLFQAEYGRRPESHEEFWREIIEKNGIRLPQLPPGHRYVYDPQRGELMVEVPPGASPP